MAYEEFDEATIAYIVYVFMYHVFSIQQHYYLLRLLLPLRAEIPGRNSLYAATTLPHLMHLNTLYCIIPQALPLTLSWLTLACTPGSMFSPYPQPFTCSFCCQGHVTNHLPQTSSTNTQFRQQASSRSSHKPPRTDFNRP